MNLEDMIVDKAIYKRFSGNGTQINIQTEPISADSNETTLYSFIPKIGGTLSLTCKVLSQSDRNIVDVFNIYIDDTVYSTFTLESPAPTLVGMHNIALEFKPFSKITITAFLSYSQNPQLTDNKTWIEIAGSIVDDVNQYIIEVNE